MRAAVVILLLLVCASLSAWGQDNTAIVLPAPPARPQAFSPEAPAISVSVPLRLEWPAWLELPGAPLASQRTNPRGRIGRWAEETCPGDVMGKPSQGCLKRVYQCSNNLKEVYQYFEGLLDQHGYTTESLSKQPYANLQLGKAMGDVFASLTMREYPAPQDENYYRQIIVFMRQPQATTKVEITFMVKSPQAQEPEVVTGVAGTWTFTHVEDRFQGTIQLSQSGSKVTGIWHTAKGKFEPDTSVEGYIHGNTVTLTRFIGGNQRYVLTLSADGNRLDGFGNGWFINHANLNMRRTAPSSAPVTPATSRKGAHLSWPPPRGTWSWAIQSVAVHRGSGIGYTSFYYEASTDRSVEEPLSLPGGGTIVGVFPDDCEFSMQNESGKSFAFRNENEAKTKPIAPGTWSVYPRGCGGVAVFLR